MKIEIRDASKRYLNQTIWKDLNHSFSAGKHVIEGGNGSGKSTLLRCLSGIERPSAGSITWTSNDGNIALEKVYQHIAFCAPSIGLYEEFQLEEYFNFIGKFKPLRISNFSEFVDFLSFPKKSLLGKPISSYSSGMQQRVKLATTIIQEVPFTFLDEPISNLDEAGVQWFYSIVDSLPSNHILLVASNNIEREAPFCKPSINLKN